MNLTLSQTETHLKRLMGRMKDVVFPQYSDVRGADALTDIRESVAAVTDPATAGTFMEAVPDICRSVQEDVDAVASIDPAVTSRAEIIFCYPAVKAMLYYRTAHKLHSLGVSVIPRMLTEYAHNITGIDIHPAARIGSHFAIDHGTGVVIGATAIIGNHVTLYQGVTLGAKRFSFDPDGHPADIPRHPILEDNVTVYSNASILGRVTIGKGSVIGGNVWLTRSVPPHSRILQGPARETFEGGAGI